MSKSVITDLLVRNYIDESGEICSLTEFDPFHDGKLRDNLLDDWEHISGLDDHKRSAMFNIPYPDNNLVIMSAVRSRLLNEIRLGNKEWQIVCVGIGGCRYDFWTYAFPRIARKSATFDPKNGLDVIELAPLTCPLMGKDHPYHGVTDWLSNNKT